MNNTPKWVPKHSSDIAKLFQRCRELECEFRFLAKKFSTEVNLDLLDLYEFQILIEESRRCFAICEEIQLSLKSQITTSASKKLQRSPYKILLQKKAVIMGDNLLRRQFQLVFVINKMVKSLLDMEPFSEILLDSALLLCTLYNNCVSDVIEKEKSSSGAKLCSNTFPSLLLQPKKIDIGIILQIVSKNRSETCCTSLISCLLATCKLDLSPKENESDSSSVEILRTLTSHLTSPTDNFSYRRISSQQGMSKNEITIIANEEDPNDPTIKFFDDMANGLFEKMSIDEKALIKEGILENLILDEESFIANIVVKCFKICPSAFDSLSNTQDFQKWINRGTRSLWTQIGSTLDHIVLWWSDAPLACRPAICARHLRDWLVLLQIEDAPEPILSTLKGLGETLTTHVTNTIWDRQFRLAVVCSALSSDGFLPSSELATPLKVPGTVTGALWFEVLSTLTNLCNSCDRNGTIPNQLPIVEQIPILHRLDHSVHSMRLWATSKAKYLCSEWNMMKFFNVVHNDIRNCLEELQCLRAPELVPADLLEVLIQVCVALRSKLISEIKDNILKLKNTCNECIDILASTCRTYSLATLSLCFPAARFWQSETTQECSNEYVSYFLKQVYLPVLKATSDYEILSLALKIACEAWLDHIYLKKIKFSRFGAINLLKDFDGVADWILNSPALPSEYTEKLSKHEVLRMCEGVGRILLRKPDEIVSMLPSPKHKRLEADDEPDDKTKLPPEMFVPNQKRWLELRARNRKTVSCLCSNGTTTEN